MPSRCNLLPSVLGGLLFVASVASFSGDTPGTVLRWDEGKPGCTFSADEDGKYRYGLWTEDFGVVVAMDSQELEKMRRRNEPIFAFYFSVRARSKGALPVSRDSMSLELVKHYHDVQAALDPDALSAALQKDTEAFAERTEHEAHEHPEKSAALEGALKERQRYLHQMQDFLKAHSFQAASLTPDHPEVTGWVFFSAKSKWVGEDWKKQEEFVLRLTIGGRVVEFPFALPPSEGDLLLRRRTNQ